jgi:hypothetical protein
MASIVDMMLEREREGEGDGGEGKRKKQNTRERQTTARRKNSAHICFSRTT